MSLNGIVCLRALLQKQNGLRMTIAHKEENLLCRQGVQITVSEPQPTGSGALSPLVLFNETMHHLNGQPLSSFHLSRTFDTYIEDERASELDWYSIEFPELTTFNCIEMTMGLPYVDGGWWTTLGVEVRSSEGMDWQPVEAVQIMPTYNFTNLFYGRRPFETYVLTFNATTAHAVRLIGRPGGSKRFTSLGRLAVYLRNLSRWNIARIPPPPIPLLFQLIPPQAIWDLSFYFMKVLDFPLHVPLLEYYVNSDQHERYKNMTARLYGDGEILRLLVRRTGGWNKANSQGWGGWNNPDALNSARYASLREPYVHLSWHNTLARAIAPIIVDGQILGEMATTPALLKGRLDKKRHKRYAQEYNIPWPEYEAAMKRSPQMTLEQMEGVAGLIGIITSTMANLARGPKQAESVINPHVARRKEIVREATDFMERHLESSITIADVAQQVALSLPYFSLLFTEETGYNPSDILINLRIERAKEYLADTAMSVKDVCRSLGYDASYLMRLFKQRTGYTMGQYARQMRNR